MLAIAFPPLDPVAIEIGPLAIRWYALAYLAGFIGGWRYALWLARRLGGRPTPREIDDFLTWAVIGTIAGGRLGYVLFYNLPYFLEHPAEAFMVWHGGMSFHGGLIGVALAMLGFARRRGLTVFALADGVAPAVPIGLFFGRLANFVNAELFGRATDVPWAVVFPFDRDPLQLPRHPSQLYEAALEGVVLFIVLAILARRESVRRHPGMLAGLFLIGYGLARFFVEFFRQPDPQLGFLWLGATMGQILSLPMIALGLWLAVRARRTRMASAAPGPARPESP